MIGHWYLKAYTRRFVKLFAFCSCFRLCVFGYVITINITNWMTFFHHFLESFSSNFPLPGARPYVTHKFVFVSSPVWFWQYIQLMKKIRNFRECSTTENYKKWQTSFGMLVILMSGCFNLTWSTRILVLFCWHLINSLHSKHCTSSSWGKAISNGTKIVIYFYGNRMTLKSSQLWWLM